MHEGHTHPYAEVRLNELLFYPDKTIVYPGKSTEKPVATAPRRGMLYT